MSGIETVQMYLLQIVKPNRIPNLVYSVRRVQSDMVWKTNFINPKKSNSQSSVVQILISHNELSLKLNYLLFYIIKYAKDCFNVFFPFHSFLSSTVKYFSQKLFYYLFDFLYNILYTSVK